MVNLPLHFTPNLSSSSVLYPYLSLSLLILHPIIHRTQSNVLATVKTAKTWQRGGRLSRLLTCLTPTCCLLFPLVLPYDTAEFGRLICYISWLVLIESRVIFHVPSQHTLRNIVFYINSTITHTHTHTIGSHDIYTTTTM